MIQQKYSRVKYKNQILDFFFTYSVEDILYYRGVSITNYSPTLIFLPQPEVEALIPQGRLEKILSKHQK